MEFIDQIGHKVFLLASPKRIISLVPSQTELLDDLGLDDKVVGITRFCVHPTHWKETKTIIGGTKNFDLEKIRKLKPDLIIGNKEENYQEGIEALRNEFPVWMSDIYTLTDALQMIRSVGTITGTHLKADILCSQIEGGFKTIKRFNGSVLYLIWKKPWMGVAKNTFIDDILTKIGFKNCLADFDRYPELSEALIKKLNPNLILLSSEPFPFREKHKEELQMICPAAHIQLVDGEMFSWYGSRLLQAPAYLNSLPFNNFKPDTF